MPSEAARTYYPVPDAIRPREMYFVCRKNGLVERVIQSEFNADRAQYSVEVLNEHEERNGREPNHYWRLRKEEEKNDLFWDRIKRNSRTYAQGNGVDW